MDSSQTPCCPDTERLPPPKDREESLHARSAADDYGLNDITIRLIAMADRMHHGKNMPKDEALARTRKAPDYLAARLICSAAGPLSGIDIPDAMSRKCSTARSSPRPPSATALPSPIP
ncbi:hypothetical protein ACTNC1_07900 [Atopobiaceae bacterium HCP3S3_A4]